MSGCRTQRSEIMATIGARFAGAWPSVPAAFLSTNSERCSGRRGPADLDFRRLTADRLRQVCEQAKSMWGR
jgi:hypothetical protein